MPTSAEPEAMEAIRKELLREIRARPHEGSAEEQQDDSIRQWWQARSESLNGMIVTWDPADDDDRVREAIRTYREMGLRPDVLSPKWLSRFTRRHLEAIFAVTPNIGLFCARLSHTSTVQSG